MTDFFDVVSAQRAHRAFTAEPVDDATVMRILEAAVLAPSAENRQPWEFVVVRDADTRAAIVAMMERAWNDYGKQFSAARVSPGLLRSVDEGMNGKFDWSQRGERFEATVSGPLGMGTVRIAGTKGSAAGPRSSRPGAPHPASGSSASSTVGGGSSWA